jgi:hypothetical protein
VGLRRSKGSIGSEAQLDLLARTKLLAAKRKAVFLTLVLIACTGDRGQKSAAPSSAQSLGPDPIVLRIARAGGTPRAAQYPKLDSVIWRASNSSSVSRVLAFDADAGILSFVDSKGVAERLDLRSGEIHSTGKTKLAWLSSANGSDIFGIDVKGEVIRSTPAGGDWIFKPAGGATRAFPQKDGTVIVLGGATASPTLWLLRPPEDSVLAKTNLSGASRDIATQAGDRLYFASGDMLVGVRGRDLGVLRAVPLPGHVTSLQPTPSGDRIYAAMRKLPEVAVIDRYSEKVIARVTVPLPPSQLRMDPLGRYLLAKHPTADSVFVVAVGTNRLIETLASRWTSDLPAFASDGKLVLNRDPDVVFVEPETGAVTATVKMGAQDFWYFFGWNGFRPRAQGLDQPVTFELGDSARDSAALKADTARKDTVVPAPKRDTTPASTPAANAQQFTVSFAALLREASARELAGKIEVNGVHPRVVPTTRGGSTIYRVVLGPFASREEADRTGKQSGRSFWVYEGYP